MKRVFPLAVMLAMIISCFVSCSSADPQKLSNKADKLKSQEITFGYDDENDKIDPSPRIALKCFSFYEKNEKIIVDAAMGIEYSFLQEIGSLPSYDSYGEKGYPFLAVYPCNELIIEKVENNKLLINGNSEPVEKKFDKEDLQKLDISREIGDISKYYHENIELDLSKCSVGDSGRVVFTFGWFFYQDNPNDNLNPDDSWTGMRKSIYYYVGENGVSVSNSIDAAMEQYKEAFPDENDTGAESQEEDVICSLKPLYLLCKNYDDVEFDHGGVIEKSFQIHSALKASTYDVTLTASSDDVEIISDSLIQVNTLTNDTFSVKFKLSNQSEPGDIKIKVTPVFSDDSLEAECVEYNAQIWYCHEGDFDYVSIESRDSLAKYSESIAREYDELRRQCEHFEISKNGNNEIPNSGVPDQDINYDAPRGEQTETADTLCVGGEEDCLSQNGSYLKRNDNLKNELGETYNSENLATSSTYTVYGFIKWNDSKGNAHAANGVLVSIYHKSGITSDLLGVAYTDSNGYYSRSFSYNGTSKNIYICVYSSGLGVSIVEPSSNNTYKYSSEMHNAVTGGDSVEISYTASKNDNLGKSMSVHQAMALASRYIYSLDGAYLDTITVMFPDNSRGTSCYVPSLNKLFILPGDAFDWDVLEHEYGHYVQNCYNISNSPGGNHTSTDNLADKRMNKSEGVRLAWGEGWATYFAINLQNKMEAASLNIPNVGDTFYQDTDDANISFDIEFLSSDRRRGEANEATVAAVLYDLTDGVNTASDEKDYIYCSNKDIWDVTKSSEATTLSEFITAFYNSTFTMHAKLKLGSTLSNYAVAAKLNSYTELDTSNPTFYWSKQGGSNSYPNNRFRLAFYDSSYELIIRTAYVNDTSIPLTNNQWIQIRSSGSTVYCCVETYQIATPQTGWYYSNLVRIDVPSGGVYKIINAGTGKCLNIYGSNVLTLYDHQNVCLWKDSGSNEQRWHITSIGLGVYIKSVIDETYGLNVYRTGSPWNCDLHLISGNETDAQVDFIETSGGYKIKLHNYDLYLSADSSTDGANVYWSASSSTLYQIWSITPG